jgi:hypothetical protein
MLDVTRRIEEEQNEAVQRPGDGNGGGGGNGGDDPIHISSETTDVHAHDLNRVQLSSELTQHYSTIAAKHGLPFTPGQMHDFLNEALDVEAAPLQAGKTAPIVGRKEMEEKYSQEIERRARTIDNQRGWSFGTTNGHILRQFKKPRPRMKTEELAQVLAWLNIFANEL